MGTPSSGIAPPAFQPSNTYGTNSNIVNQIQASMGPENNKLMDSLTSGSNNLDQIMKQATDSMPNILSQVQGWTAPATPQYRQPFAEPQAQTQAATQTQQGVAQTPLLSVSLPNQQSPIPQLPSTNMLSQMPTGMMSGGMPSMSNIMSQIQTSMGPDQRKFMDSLTKGLNLDQMVPGINTQQLSRQQQGNPAQSNVATPQASPSDVLLGARKPGTQTQAQTLNMLHSGDDAAGGAGGQPAMSNEAKAKQMMNSILMMMNPLMQMMNPNALQGMMGMMGMGMMM